LARNISGLELPPPPVADTTFEPCEATPVGDDDIALVLAAQLRNAVIDSAKKYSEVLDSDIEDEEVNSDNNE
jgi:hypothetical protein